MNGTASLLTKVVVRQGTAMPCLRSASTGAPVRLAFNQYGRQEYSGNTSDSWPLVILHGLFGQKRNWHSIAKALHRRLNRTIFAVDLRNHGDSPWASTMGYPEMAEDVIRFINEVVPQEGGGEPQKVHLVGHSMGGKTAMYVALCERAQARLASLIVEDVAPRSYDTAGHRDMSDFVDAMQRADLSTSRCSVGRQLADAVPDLVTRDFLLTNLINEGSLLRWKPNLSTIRGQLSRIFANDLPAGSFRGRTLFVSGSLSPYVTQRDRPFIEKLFPNVQFSVIDGAGHWVHADKPHEFMEEVIKFVGPSR